MADSRSTSTSSFLRDALTSYAPFSNQQKQQAQKRALKWLQQHVDHDLEDKTILKQFGQKWRAGSARSSSAEELALHLENLPGSYKGQKSVSGHQEDALNFMQDVVPLGMQEDFNQRWNAKAKLVVSNPSGATFKVDQREIALLQQEDADGEGHTWYQVEAESLYYLLSSEPQGDDYQVVLSEEISPQNRNVWFVSQEQVKISNV
jgi:hypothetical protein